jgi:excisionase family DNA binding protein
MNLMFMIIPIGFLRKIWKHLDDRQLRTISYLMLLPVLYGLIMVTLFVVLVMPDGKPRAGLLTTFLCISPFVVIVGSLFGIVMVSMQRPSTTASEGSLLLKDAAKYVGMNEADLLKLIQSGKLRAQHVGDEYRVHREILNALKEMYR